MSADSADLKAIAKQAEQDLNSNAAKQGASTTDSGKCLFLQCAQTDGKTPLAYRKDFPPNNHAAHAMPSILPNQA